MEQVSEAFNGFTNLMEQNIRGVQIGCYSVAFVGLTIALRRVKPFSKFKKPSDIPNRFIKERRELTGLVKRVEPNGAVLMIQHKPLINIPVVPSGELPVKISGVNVTGLGVNWLQAVVAESEVKFIPVVKEKEFVQCEVMFMEQMKDLKPPQLVSLGENLVKIGFGTPLLIGKPLSDDPSFRTYYNRLRKAERYAIHKQLGWRYYIKPTKKVLLALALLLKSLLVKTSKQISKLPSKLPKIYAA